MTKLARKHLTRKGFANRLAGLLIDKEMLQADLARATGLSRDSISGYVNERNMPDPVSLKKLAKALGVNEADLLPNITEQAIDQATDPSFEMKAIPEDPNRVWLRINHEVSLLTATKVMQLVQPELAEAASRRVKARK